MPREEWASLGSTLLLAGWGDSPSEEGSLGSLPSRIAREMGCVVVSAWLQTACCEALALAAACEPPRFGKLERLAKS